MPKKEKSNLKINKLADSKGLKIFVDMADWLDKYISGKTAPQDPTNSAKDSVAVLVARLKTSQASYQEEIKKELSPQARWAICSNFVFDCLYNEIDLATLTTPILMLDAERSPIKAINIIEYHDDYQGANFNYLPALQQRISVFYSELNTYLSERQYDPLFPEIRSKITDKIGTVETLREKLALSLIIRQGLSARRTAPRYCNTDRVVPIIYCLTIMTGIFLLVKFEPGDRWVPTEGNSQSSADSMQSDDSEAAGHFVKRDDLGLYYGFGVFAILALTTLLFISGGVLYELVKEELAREHRTGQHVRATLTTWCDTLRGGARERPADIESGLQPLLGDNLPPLMENGRM